MNNLIGVRWGDLKSETKEFLLKNSNVWDNVKEGDCIFDLTENLSVAGYIKCNKEGDYEYIVKDEAIIYNPSEGNL